MKDCKNCGKPLDKSQRVFEFKSCPQCSQEDGEEHIFYLEADFGYSDERVTKANPDGIQSWCTCCRDLESPLHAGYKRCSEIKKQ